MLRSAPDGQGLKAALPRSAMARQAQDLPGVLLVLWADGRSQAAGPHVSAAAGWLRAAQAAPVTWAAAARAGMPSASGRPDAMFSLPLGALNSQPSYANGQPGEAHGGGGDDGGLRDMLSPLPSFRQGEPAARCAPGPRTPPRRQLSALCRGQLAVWL